MITKEELNIYKNEVEEELETIGKSLNAELLENEKKSQQMLLEINKETSVKHSLKKENLFGQLKTLNKLIEKAEIIE